MPTANDPLDPGHVLGTLKEVKQAIEEVAEREQRAKADFEQDVIATRRAARLEQEKSDAGSQQRRAEAEAEISNRREAELLFHERRKAWIQERCHGARQALADRIQARRDQVVGKAQGELMKRQEERKEEYDRAKTELHALHEKATADCAEAEKIAREGLKQLSGFKPFFEKKIRTRSGPVSVAGAGDLRAEAAAALADVRRQPVAKLFRFLPFPLLLLVAIGIAAWTSGTPGQVEAWLPRAGIATGVLVVAYLAALGAVWAVGSRLAAALQRIRMEASMSVHAMNERVAGLKAEIQAEEAKMREGFSETLRESGEETEARMRRGRAELEEKLARVVAKEESLHEIRMRRRETEATELRARLEAQLLEVSEKIEAMKQDADAGTRQRHDQELAEIGSGWEDEVTQPLDALGDLAKRQSDRFAGWTERMAQDWQPPSDSEEVVPFATLKLGRSDFADRLPANAAFDLPGSLEVPLNLGFPVHGSVLFEGDMAASINAMNAVALRLLSTRPAGQAAFTFIDPVGLGRDFAGLMHLADYEDTLIHGRIWTQTPQIEERLAELNEHVEKVIQMYLRNEFETISEYNRQAGEIAEKYQFVFIAGFPANFSETAMQRLRSLAASGARCGVFLMIHMDKPGEAALDAELRKSCLCLKQEGDIWKLEGQAGEVILERAPEPALLTSLVHRFGQASVDSNRVEVPFSSIAPQGEWWTEETADELRVPIGRTGAKKLQYLAIGKGTRQHALIAGKTGSGKSTLFHVIITNLALHCSPEEVEFYLVDFKKGVEFKCYGSSRLPHARVVAVESDREFGLSVLRRVDEELRQRGEHFREAGVQDVTGYRKATGKPLPRTLLLIDEFQEFFTEDDGTAQEASLLLDRIVRQGRAFGIHVILGSQTLGGAYTLARATLGQMVIRIALQCNEADAYLIMDDDNPAPRLLTRPGEGIYNDNAGALAANSPFQTVWLDEEKRNARLGEVAALAKERGFSRAPVVFEGNAPADLRDNEELVEALAHPPTERPAQAKAWLGAPNSIKGPTAAMFRRESGSHLLVVGQGEERMKALMEAAMTSLSAQYPADAARFVVLDGEGSQGDLARMARSLPQPGEVHLPGEVDSVLGELAGRVETPDETEVFVFVRDLHRFKALREEDEFKFSFDDDASSGTSPAKAFQTLVSEGAAAGIHLIVGVDTWSNLTRWIPRKSLADFRMRVLFQMSANDSAALIDSPAAGNLGLHRALLHDEAMGTLETFRPYGRAARVVTS
ncbi:FtsK/SpoIIIE domain-containing protein [Haloferula sargassicola]|uniref:FtsK domain-containing protein n=1 Tax=Haloferula sargassicola TaxID=490096 RepID=A0ABP9UQP8_9BACT